MEALVKAVKNHALANYESGWDIVIECYGNKEIAEAIGSATTVEKAIENVQEEFAIELRKERSDEIQSFEW